MISESCCFYLNSLTQDAFKGLKLLWFAGIFVFKTTGASNYGGHFFISIVQVTKKQFQSKIFQSKIKFKKIQSEK